jgi:hypothetical protein
MKHLELATLCSMLFVGCGNRQTVATVKAIEAPISIVASQIEKSSLKAARVVAYRFALPGEGSELPMESGFSLITRDGKLDMATLKNLKLAQATLTPDLVSRLVDSVYGSHGEINPAACYDPHHLFLFYDTADLLINVVEVCFDCTGLNARPQIEEPQWYRHDFRELARICDEAGIGMTSGTAEDQIRFWVERDRDWLETEKREENKARLVAPH